MSFKHPTNRPVGRLLDALVVGDDVPAPPAWDPNSSHVSGAGHPVETVRVVAQDPASQGPFVTINAVDFDEAIHTLYDGPGVEVEVPAGRWVHR